MLSFINTATVAILLALSQQDSAMAIPQIAKMYDHGGLFVDNQCRLKPVLDGTHYQEWVRAYGWVQRSCFEGTKFDARACQCLAVPKIDGGLPTKSDQKDPTHKQETSSSIEAVISPAICQLKQAAERTSYLELVHGQGFLTRTCPTGTAFDALRCGCTIVISETTGGQTAVDSAGDTSHAVEEATQEVPTKEVWEKNEVPDSQEVLVKKNIPYSKIPCNKKQAEKSNFYMELIQGYGWMARPCPGGTVFNTVKCECLMAVAERIDDSSKTVDSTAKSGSQEPMSSTNDLQKKLVEPHLKDKVVSEEESDSKAETEKRKTTSKPCEMKADSGNRYLELVEGFGWMSRPCPVGTVFDVKICQCSSTAPESMHPTVPGKRPESTTTTAPCTRKPSHTKSLYLQMVPGGGLVLMNCAEGTVYNARSCDCTLPTDGEDSSDDNVTREPITVDPRFEPVTDREVTSDDRSGDDKAPATAMPRPEAKIEVDGEDTSDNINEDIKGTPKSVAQTPKPEVDGKDTNDNRNEDDKKAPKSVVQTPTHEEATSDNSNENYKMAPKTVAPKPQDNTDGEDINGNISGYSMKGAITVAPRPYHKTDWQVTGDDSSKTDMNEPTTTHESKSDRKDTNDGDDSKVTDTTDSAVKDTKKEKPCDSVVAVLRKIMATQRGRDHITCFRKLSANPKIYLELSEDLKWVTRECPLDTIFVRQLCRCSAPLSSYSNDIQDKEKSDKVVDDPRQQTKNGDVSLLEKMLAQMIFEQLNNFPLEKSSNLRPFLATGSPTRSKYVTAPHPNVRIS